VQLLGIDQREAGEHTCIDPIAFGMTLVVAAQISDLLTIDQVDGHVVTHEVDGDRKPGHACWFHHDLHRRLLFAVAGTRQELI